MSCFDEEYVIRKISDSASMTQASDNGQCEVAKLARTDSHSSFAYTNAYEYPVTQKPAYNFPDLSDFKALSGFIDLSTKDDLNKGVSTSEVSTDFSGSDLCSFNFSKNSKVQNHVLSSFTSQLSNQSVESAYELSLEDGFFQEVKKIQKTKKIATIEHSSYDQNIGILPYASADLSGWSSFLESSIQTKNAKEADVFSCFHYDYTVGGVRCTYEL